MLGHEQTWILVSQNVTLHHLVSSLYVWKYFFIFEVSALSQQRCISPQKSRILDYNASQTSKFAHFKSYIYFYQVVTEKNLVVSQWSLQSSVISRFGDMKPDWVMKKFHLCCGCTLINTEFNRSHYLHQVSDYFCTFRNLQTWNDGNPNAC
jgi:hypothetical protein